MESFVFVLRKKKTRRGIRAPPIKISATTPGREWLIIAGTPLTFAGLCLGANPLRLAGGTPNYFGSGGGGFGMHHHVSDKNLGAKPNSMPVILT